jgi:hypothetical protein
VKVVADLAIFFLLLWVPVSPAIPPILPRHSPSLLEKGKTFSSFANIGSLNPIPEIKSTDSHDDFLRLSHSKSNDAAGGGKTGAGAAAGIAVSHLPSLLPEGNSPRYSPLRKSQTLPSGLFTRDGGSSGATAPSSLLFQGTINFTTTEEEKKRIQLVSKNESERASERLVLPDARDPLIKYKELLEEFPIIKETIETQEKAEKERKRKQEEQQQKERDRKSSRKGRNRRSRSKEKEEEKEEKGQQQSLRQKPELIQKGKLTLVKKPDSPGMKEEDSFFKEFPNLKDGFPQKGTKAIKTRTDEETLPNNPYGSWHEETKVMNTGVAAGAGLMLWQPRDRITSNHRYRVSSQISASSPLRPLPKENYQNQPGVSPNIRAYGYNSIHGDNIYSKSTTASGGGRVKPFVSAT